MKKDEKLSTLFDNKKEPNWDKIFGLYFGPYMKDDLVNNFFKFMKKKLSSSKTKKMKAETKIFNANVHRDEFNDSFSISLIEKGGPIISDKNLDKAKEKFEEALQLAVAVMNLRNLDSRWVKIGGVKYY